MSNDQKQSKPEQEPTAVAVHDPQAQQLQQGLDSAVSRDRMVRVAATQIAGQSWGKGLSKAEQGAVARYAIEAGLDPLRHLNILGGAPYVNAEAYRDKLSAEYPGSTINFINITADAERRAFWSIPERAKAAYVCEIALKDQKTGEFTVYVEASYAPKRTNDSIGAEFPGDKARTSALRRCARQCVPIWSDRIARLDEELKQLHVQAAQTVAAEPERAIVGVVQAPEDQYGEPEDPSGDE